MSRPELREAVNARYSSLAGSECCLSCGGAVNLAEARPGEVCVDLGSGRGRDVLRLAEAVGTSGHAFGIDTSEGMLEKARETATRLGVANASFLRADLQDLPLDSGSVDLVISNCTINHAADKQAVWNEIHRVLKTGRQVRRERHLRHARRTAGVRRRRPGHRGMLGGRGDTGEILRPARPCRVHRGGSARRERSVPERPPRRMPRGAGGAAFRRRIV